MTQAIHASLVGHPDNPQGFVERVGVTLVQKADGSLMLAYAIHGPTAMMRISTREAPAPAEALWRTTCCEFFVAPETAGVSRNAGHSASPYREFNFSPSGQWAAYDFAVYRQRQPDAATPPAPLLWSRHQDGGLRIDVSLTPSALPSGRLFRCALAVIVERHDGQLGYWALAHPEGKPDFHHPAGFTLALERTA